MIDLRDWIVIIDGPPASGKSTLCRELSHKYGCKVLSYKRLGLCNIMSYIMLKALYPRTVQAIDPDQLAKDRADPIMLLDKRILFKIRSLIFVCEIFYKFTQLLKFFFVLILFRGKCVIIDEYIALSTANYVNLYLHNGLHESHLYILFCLDLSVAKLISFISGKRIVYYYIDRDVSVLAKLWSKRTTKPYDVKFLAIVRACYRSISIKLGGRNIFKIKI